MKPSLSLLTKIFVVLATSAAFSPLPLSAHENSAKTADHLKPGELSPVNAKTDATWLAQARASYPMDRCSVSGDKFDGGDMGKPQDYVYKQAGQPDRLIRFCCKDCVRDFKKHPAKYLKTIDDAAAAKANPASAK